MKRIIFIPFILALMLTSCDQENKGAIYMPDDPYVAFASSVVPDNVLSVDNGFSVSCVLVRSDLNGSTTANVELEMNADIDGVFALENNTVSFENGNGTAYAKIIPLVSPDQLDPTKTYVFKLTITSGNASELFNTATYKAGFQFEYVGTADFNSEFYEISWPVEVYKLAVGSKTLYKLKELYDVGTDVTVTVEGSTITVADQVAWYYDDEYGDVYVRGSGTISGKIFTMLLTHYIPDVYAWDPATEVLTLP